MHASQHSWNEWEEEINWFVVSLKKTTIPYQKSTSFVFKSQRSTTPKSHQTLLICLKSTTEQFNNVWS